MSCALFLESFWLRFDSLWAFCWVIYTFTCVKVSRFTLRLEWLDQAYPTANNGIGATLISWSSLLKEVKPVPSSEHLKCSVHFFIRDATYLYDLDRCPDVIRQRGLLYHCEDKGWWQKQIQERWSKTKSHLDFLKLSFQSQTAGVASLRCSHHGLGVLNENVGELVSSDHLFKVNCKVSTLWTLKIQNDVFVCYSQVSWKIPESTVCCFILGELALWIQENTFTKLLSILHR